MLFFINLPLAVAIPLNSPQLSPAVCSVQLHPLQSSEEQNLQMSVPPQPHTTQFSKPHFCFLCYNVLFVFIKITKTE